MNRTSPISPPVAPANKTTATSPRERAYAESDFIAWIYEAQDAAYLGANTFERHFNIAGEKMLCRVEFYWTDKADQTPRMGGLQCIPIALEGA
jgi:hypothetical protein